MIPQTYADIVTPELLTGAIENNEYEGFLQDYHVLHCLIRKYMPTTFFEVGQNMGSGTNIICNAGYNWLMKVYSLDLPPDKVHLSLQHPQNEGKGIDKVGSNCKFAHTQIRADSMEYDFSQFPCEGYFCDGEHTRENVYHETIQMLNQKPKLIVYHDTNIEGVYDGIISAFNLHVESINYYLYRVTDTRISYAIRKVEEIPSK